MMQEIRVAGLNEPTSHYTDAVRYDNLLFISGVASLDGKPNLVGGRTSPSKRGKSFAT